MTSQIIFNLPFHLVLMLTSCKRFEVCRGAGTIHRVIIINTQLYTIIYFVVPNFMNCSDRYNFGLWLRPVLFRGVFHKDPKSNLTLSWT